ncbi:MAG TPA: VacJ family lipoprotein [Usitatibacter sp.]|jgi:phospholipid-binding lipoprotein MlaA|nr:VacJ family lipoprotein [Usitatibacter sp.]
MRSILAALALVLLAGCATTADNPDPWESMNRKTFAFNDAVDRAVLKPVATGYKKVTPSFVQAGVNNFFDNVLDVNTSLNQFLQGKPKQGLSDAARFVFNTVFGIFGLWDVATPLGLEKHDEDFGQTLGVWGVDSGPYLVIPLLGPSSARDAPARIVDPQWFYNSYVNPESLYWGLWTLDKVRTRANLLQAETILQQAALDRYSFIRDAWMQRRRSQVYDGHPPRPKDEDQ